jgi:hypothetical protein
MSLPVSVIPFNRFLGNLARCYRLLSIVRVHQQPPLDLIYPAADILRAAIVLAHASLEDLLRSVAGNRWTLISPEEVADELPFPGSGKVDGKFGSLLAHRGRSIDALVEESLCKFQEARYQYLDRLTLNSVDDICALLRKIKVDHSMFRREFARIAWLITRRHKVVHNADLSSEDLSQPPPLSPDDVERIFKGIDALSEFVCTLAPAVLPGRDASYSDEVRRLVHDIRLMNKAAHEHFRNNPREID